MKAFTIDAENNIVFHSSAKAAPKTEGIEVFASENALAEIAAAWPAGRLVEIWNSIPGVTPVKKFTNRKMAVARIWKAIQSLGEAEAPQSAHVAPEGTPAKKKTSRAKKAPKPAPKAKGSREASKTATVLELLKRKGGVTAKELMTATGWQAHSVRGFISGTVGKKMGLTVESTKGADGERTYSISA